MQGQREGRLLIPPPRVAVGRVAHRERSERCDGWGVLRRIQPPDHLLRHPPPDRPSAGHPPHRFAGGGRSKRTDSGEVEIVLVPGITNRYCGRSFETATEP